MANKTRPEDEFILDDTASTTLSDISQGHDNSFTPLSFEEPSAPKRGFGRHISKILMLVLAGAAGYFYYQYSLLSKNPQAQAQAEAQQLMTTISKIFVLPEGETPTIATVSDPEKLKDQPFFARAVKGDKVLIYTNAKKAILYNPTENKIVDVAPINIGTPTPTPRAR